MPTKDHRLSAPKDEIEITPEMIEAGFDALCSVLGVPDIGQDYEEAAQVTFSKMCEERSNVRQAYHREAKTPS